MYKLETAPLMLSGVFKSGWKLYKSSIRYVFIWSLIISILHIIPYLFGFVGFYYQNAAGRLDFSWWGILIFIILLFVEAFFVAVLFYTMYQDTTEQKVNSTAAMAQAKQVLLPMYLGLIVYYFAINIGILLFIIPAVFVAILFAMFIPCIVIEKQSVYSAFDSSARLVWGHWWQTFFALVIPYALVYLLRNFVKLSPGTVGEWLYLVDAIIIAVVMPYIYSVLLVQFNNIKVIKSLPEPISQRPRTNQ